MAWLKSKCKASCLSKICKVAVIFPKKKAKLFKFALSHKCLQQTLNTAIKNKFLYCLSSSTLLKDCTFFTRKEILRVHKRFRELRPDLVPRQMTEGQASSVKVPKDCIEKMPELRENPFRRRICEAFSRDGQGNLSFEDFLDAFSVFSEQAPRDIKVYYAFKIYDFDQDGFIGRTDLLSCLTTMTKNELSPEEHQQIADKVMEEADVDGDGKLSFLEFEHVILRAPDFLSTFHIRI